MLQEPAGVVHPGGPQHPHEGAEPLRERRCQLQQAAGRLITTRVCGECLNFLLFVFSSYYFDRSLSLAILQLVFFLRARCKARCVKTFSRCERCK